MKWRNSKERELLASGGSRDQTLPNKNNPNPDLSDARTDRPPSLSPTSPLPSSPNAEQQPASTAGSGSSTPNKLNESRKTGNGRGATANCNGKSDKIFKLEYDESRPPAAQQHQQQLFNFYDKVRDINTSLAFANRPNPMNASGGALNVSTGSAGSNLSNFYYDEYDSNSDSDEEISVTWKWKIQRLNDE